MKELYPDEWTKVFSKIFFRAGSDLWNFAAKELLDARKHKQVSTAFANILSKSEEHPELYLWLCRAAFMGKFPTVLGEHNKIDFVERLLALISDLAKNDAGESKPRAAARKKLLAKARDTFSISDFNCVQQIIEDSSEDQARRIYTAVRLCHGLTDTATDKTINIIIAEHPNLAPPPSAEDLEEEVLYTTIEGLRRKEAEFDRVMNDEIPENQEALKIAISFGDLSENAEYTAAREQQGILMKKAESIKKELEQAKLIDPETVSGDVVSTGTAIEVRSLSKKKTERYVILGPWDSDIEKGVVSYLAPFAAAFLGKKAGDKAMMDFTEDKDEYEIISIKKAI